MANVLKAMWSFLGSMSPLANALTIAGVLCPWIISAYLFLEQRRKRINAQRMEFINNTISNLKDKRIDQLELEAAKQGRLRGEWRNFNERSVRGTPNDIVGTAMKLSEELSVIGALDASLTFSNFVEQMERQTRYMNIRAIFAGICSYNIGKIIYLFLNRGHTFHPIFSMAFDAILSLVGFVVVLYIEDRLKRTPLQSDKYRI